MPEGIKVESVRSSSASAVYDARQPHRPDEGTAAAAAAAKMLRGPCRDTGPLSAVSSIHASCCHGCALRVERDEHHRIFTNRVTVAHLGIFCASNPVPFA
ncbi:hypothetical protein MRX96_048585 [Rhipicephalus microplus]